MNPTTSTTPASATEINCAYQISPQVSHIDPNVIIKWTEKAAEQAFTFDAAQIDKQMEQLKTCFTNQGWQGFQDAFKKSGNMNSIKSQQLSVSAMVESPPTIVENKGNEWKVSVPLQVVYQNKQQKLTQPLHIDVLVGRKLTGELGIMQIIATPKQPATPIQQAPVTPTTQKTPAAAAPSEPSQH